MDEGLPVLPGAGNDGGHILEVGLRRDTPLQVVLAAPVQPVLVDGLVVDGVLLRRCHLAGVEVEGDAGPVADVGEQGQLLGDGGVTPEGQDTAVQAAQHVGVRVELHGCGGDEVQEILDAGFRGLGRDPFIRFLLCFFSHVLLPTSLRRSPRNSPWSRPVGNRPPIGA